MKTEWHVERRTQIPASAAEVWARVVTPEGINDEMLPWLAMSLPRGAQGLTIDNLEIGKPLGRAWLRLFGVLPYDYDDLAIVELEPGRRFREESTMLGMRRWVHDRTVEPLGDQDSLVIDRITLAPRLLIRLLGPVIHRVVGAFFAHRHRRLLRHFSSW